MEEWFLTSNIPEYETIGTDYLLGYAEIVFPKITLPSANQQLRFASWKLKNPET